MHDSEAHGPQDTKGEGNMRIGAMIEPKWVARAFLSSDGQHSFSNEARRLIDAGANHIEISGEAEAIEPRTALGVR